MAATTLDCLINYQKRSEAGGKAAEKRKARYEGLTKDMRDTKRLTAGLLVKNKIYCLNDELFVAAYDELDRRKAEHEKSRRRESATRRQRIAVQFLPRVTNMVTRVLTALQSATCKSVAPTCSAKRTKAKVRRLMAQCLKSWWIGKLIALN